MYSKKVFGKMSKLLQIPFRKQKQNIFAYSLVSEQSKHSFLHFAGIDPVFV